MKKSISILVLLLSITCCSRAQSLQIPGISQSIDRPLLINKLPVTDLKDPSNLRTLTWNWDTIVSYDTLEVQNYRYSQTFDQHGLVLSQLSEQL